jgi:large subunit ribosomal protein L32
MAAEPKRRHSKARKRTRRASISLEAKQLVKCTSCGEPKLSHIVCASCGMYDGKQVITKTKAKITRAE